MFRPSEPRRLRRIRRSRLDVTLPTSVPGIAFSAAGTVWCRPLPGAPEHVSFVSAQAAARAEVTRLAGAVVSLRAPEAIAEAAQETALTLADWRTPDDHPLIQVRARLDLVLPSADAARAERYLEAQRAAQLDQVLLEKKLTHLAAVILADIDIASRWWLDYSLRTPDPQASWRLFDEIIRPMVAYQSSGKDQATRFARLIVILLQRFDDEPDRLETFLRITEANFITMGWHDLAEHLRTPG